MTQLDRWLAEHKLSAAALARLAGLSRATVARHVRNQQARRYEPSMRTVIALSKATGISVRRLMSERKWERNDGAQPDLD